MNPQHYRSEALEAIARHVILRHDGSLLSTPAPIPVESIMERLYGLKMEFQFIRNNGRVLGETIFEDTVVPIYERENGEGVTAEPQRPAPAGAKRARSAAHNAHAAKQQTRLCTHRRAVTP